MNTIFQKIASQNNLHLVEASPLSGGDINEVFWLKCNEGDFVLKVNNTSKYPGMFKAEAKALRLLKSTNSFLIPNVIANGTVENDSYLLMEYIKVGTPAEDFPPQFAENLAKLHKTTQTSFGLDHENYIGSLPQKNESCDTVQKFYITQRLEPQFQLATERGFQFENLSNFFKNISEEIPNEAPSLIHGDLWSGNYLVSEKGEPGLIDPAVAFAPREMDIAMMKLFGGFSEKIFSEYNALFPLNHDWKERIPLWQLYYLLVHLNLFGGGYFHQVKSIVSKYS